jgi:hypothetical protein
MGNPFRKRDKGYNKIPMELTNLPELSNSAFRVFVYMCSFDTCFASYKEIQRATGLTSHTISKAITELVDRKMIQYDKGYWNSTKSKSNKYVLLDTEHWLLSRQTTVKNTAITLEKIQSAPLEKLQYTNKENTNKEKTNKLNDSSSKTSKVDTLKDINKLNHKLLK